jgi:hypothetical protein
MVREACPLKIEALAAIPPERASFLKIAVQPSVNYFASEWPIDAIWLANQQKEVPTVDLASGGTTIEVRRSDEGFSWQRLDPGSFAFRSALAKGFSLGRRRQLPRRTPHSTSPLRSIASSARGLSPA